MEVKQRPTAQGLLTSKGLAEFTGLPERTINYYIRKGKLPAYEMGKGRYLISLYQLIEFIEARSQTLLSVNGSSTQSTESGV